MDELPIILIVGIQNSKPERLIKLILENEDQFNSENENTSPYIWRICNKYYSAELQFRVFNCTDVTSSNVGDHVEAENFFTELNELNNCFKNMKSAIQTMVCSDEVVENKKAVVEDWCIKNKYELIQLKATMNAENTEVDFEECFGIDRVKEVLQAHQWPNLVMKDKSSNSVLARCSHLQDIESLKNEKENIENSPANCSEDEFDLEKSVDDMEQLSTLFRDLQSMKQDISSLSGEEKLKQAERVVKTFWRAMHGDSDEFSDSEDES